MKKIISVFMFMFLLILVGCSNDSESKSTTTQENTNELNSVTLNDNQSLAFSTYLSSGILSSISNESSISNIMFNQTIVNGLFLSETTNEEDLLEVESDLDVINVYFDKLKVFMDNGVDSTLTIQEEESTNEAYDQQVTYTIDGITYTLYYSYIIEEEQETETTTEETTTTETETTTEETTTTETETTTEETTTTETETTTEETTTETTDDELYDRFHIVGLMIIDEVEYELEGYSVLENGEEKIFFETIDRENSNNYVRVKIKNEEGMQKFDLVSVIDGVEKRSDIKLIQEENNVKVHLRLFNGEEISTYQFKKIVEEDTTLYMLNYNLGDTKGVIKIFVTTDENGEIVYRYQINEGGKSKQIEKGKNKGKNEAKGNHQNTAL